MNEIFNKKKSSVVADLNYYNDEEFKKSMEDFDLINFHSDKKLIILRTNREYLSELARNRLVRPRLIQLGFQPESFTFSKTIPSFYKKLFKLSPNLEPQLQEFLRRAKPNNQTKLVCMQIRVGGHDMQTFTDPNRSNARDVKLMWSFMRTKFTDSLEEQSVDYRIFLTTDNQTVQDEALQEYGHKLIVNRGKTGHMDNIALHSGGSECGDISRTIVDFHCLEHCDMAIVTSISQFGVYGLWVRPRIEPGSFYRYQSGQLFPLERDISA